MNHVVNNANKAQPDVRLPAMQHETKLGGLRLILLPPGVCDVWLVLDVNLFDVNLNQITHEMAVNSDLTEQGTIRPETLAFLPRGTEFRLRATNSLPGCVLEVDNATLDTWMEAGEVSGKTSQDWSKYQFDGVAAELGRSAIRYLMHATRSKQPTDRLTVEALALGIAARGMAHLGGKSGDASAEVRRWQQGVHRSAIDRAIDLIETRLCESDLSIQELASAACLSSSHFSSVFKSMAGETPYAFVLRRRAEYARDLIIGTSEPLAQIAFNAGFSSQAHMTLVIRRVFGTTPAAIRAC